MFSKLISIPFAIAMIVALYLTFEVSSSYSVYIIPPTLVLASIYFLQPQIDWWWYTKHPPKMNPQLEQILRQKIPFYAALPTRDQERFRNRVELYTRANAYIAKGAKEDGVPPDDVIYFISTCITQLTFGLADFRLPKFERIAVYPAPFPSPQYPEKLHASEIFAEDGVLVFAVEHLMRGILNADKYNIGFHEYAQAFIASFPDENYVHAEEVDWAVLEQISGFSEEQIHNAIGLPEIDIRAVAIHHFFYFPQAFKTHLPEGYERCRKIFNLDLLKEGSPIVDRDRAEVENRPW